MVRRQELLLPTDSNERYPCRHEDAARAGLDSRARSAAHEAPRRRDKMADTINDIIHSKLATHYPALGTNASIDDLLNQFAIDNTTFIRPYGSLTFYSAAQFESLADAAYRWWGAYVP